jgi:phosphoglycerate kinase
MLSEYIGGAKTILWNGPLGDYEHGFKEQTLACAKLIAASPAYSVVGGGDTVASIESLENQEEFGFLSTAGGAMLTFLEEGTLPALEALLNSRS